MRVKAIAGILAAVAALGALSEAAEVTTGLDALIQRVGERVAAYYGRAQSVMCVNESTVQPVLSNLSPVGLSRTVESELRVELTAGGDEQPSEATVIREIKRVNGRPPRERDRTDRSGCTDPNPLSPEPLAFLLPAHRGEYRFTSVREGREKNRAVLIVDFMSAKRSSAPELIEDPHGHDDCFDWSGPIAGRGRIWIDADTFDVLRVERHIDGPVDLRVPSRLQARYGLTAWVVLDRDDQTMRFRPVAFRDPDEVLMLPQSIESLTLLRGGLQSIRRTDTFRNYRRFLTEGRVVKTP